MVTGALGNFCLRASAGQHLDRPLVSPDGRTAGITNRGGRPHRTNEDSFLAIRDGAQTLLAVCDGVGGLPHGDVASTVAVKSLEYQFHSPGFSIKQAAIKANRMVFEKSQRPSLSPTPPTIPVYFEKEDGTVEKAEFPAPPSPPDFCDEVTTEIGTTLVAVLINTKRALGVDAGDSKAFLIDRRNKIFVMNENHNYSSRIYQALNHPRFPLHSPRHQEPKNYYEWERNYHLINPITASLGSHPDFFIFDHFSRRIRNGDRMLLTSDGLTNYLPYPKLVQILLRFSPVEDTVCELFDATLGQIKEDGRHGDNITILLHENSVN